MNDDDDDNVIRVPTNNYVNVSSTYTGVRVVAYSRAYLIVGGDALAVAAAVAASAATILKR